MVGLAACSERQRDDKGGGDGVIVDPGQQTKRIVSVTKNAAWDYISKSISNMDSTVYTDPEWFNIDFVISFRLTEYQKVGEVYTKTVRQKTDYTITVKANINLKDNNKSNVFIELKDVYNNAIKIGVYYFQSTLYLNIGGRRMYTEQLNMATIGRFIVDSLDEAGIDISSLWGTAFTDRLTLTQLPTTLPSRGVFCLITPAVLSSTAPTTSSST